MDEATKKIIRDMLDDSTAEVQMFAGMRKVSGEYSEHSTSAEFEPTGGKTVVLSINGGANNVRIDRVKIEGEEDDE
jgi:hypothetical protein